MSIITDGGFETGDLSVYEGGRIERVAVDRIQVYHRSTGKPVRFGNYACQFLVKQGDDPVNASGYRAELNMRHLPNRIAHGQERWYRFSSYFPSIPGGGHPSQHPTNGAINTQRWAIFWQVHQSVDYGTVPLGFSAQHNEIGFSTLGTSDNGSIRRWTIPLTLNQWHDFILHVRWHTDPGVGFVELWHQGFKVVNLLHCRTYISNDPFQYIKYGYYRGTNHTDDATVLHDGMMIATAASDVMGGSTAPPPPPPDGPQPTDPGPTPSDPPPPPPPDPDAPPPVRPPPPEPDAAVPGVGVRMEPATPRSKRRIWTGHGF